MDMSRMNKVLKVSVGDLWVDVQAGCVYNALNEAMLRIASLTGDNYMPYAPTNRQLYEMILALQ